ncbi:type II toxin-antitoxin system HicB family antitoxin [Dubosiella newyorkensis]|jgi:predicted RNase H-like HicB family nuclease|uniref:type II toxin-antitoxin system HicB family antitoxin n=1 Tax=Dubosiella newyorkensis TaxID=1862672 RepID=UPI0023F40E01|nr:type II toxin-antitoxin system HicB family antitoxin [Dubosiella newyorkensis]
MKKVTYLAILEPASTGYSVYFPDFPGCISFGETIDKANAMAQEALSLHYYGMEKDGDTIPSPTQTLDPEATKGNLVCPITIYPELYSEERRNRRVKTNTTIPAWLKEKAEAQGINFSRILETALLERLES